MPVQGLVTRTWSRVVAAHVARGEYRGEITPWQLSGCITGEFTVSVATHSSVAWRIPWSLAGYSPWGHRELGMNK